LIVEENAILCLTVEKHFHLKLLTAIRKYIALSVLQHI